MTSPTVEAPPDLGAPANVIVPPPVEAPAFHAGLMEQAATRAIRLVALMRVAEIQHGYDQMVAGDPEGLHDLRVALRRLRTWLRAYRPFVNETLKRRTRDKLASITRSTNGARDAEVAVEWIAAETDVPPRARAGFADALQRLEKERDAASATIREKLDRALPRLVATLNRQLAITDDSPEVVQSVLGESMSNAALAVIEQHKARLALALAKVKSIADADEQHRARIVAKRLRYVLEPLYEKQVAGDVVAPLVELQDHLGAARDAHLLKGRFLKEIGKRASRDARRRARASAGIMWKGEEELPFRDVRRGLVELVRRAHRRERESFRAFRKLSGRKVVREMLARLPG